MESRRRRIEFYQTSKDEQPFRNWLEKLKDREGRAKIRAKLDRLNLGNFGGCKSLGGGLHELKIDFGPGYRIYFADLADYKKRTDENKTKL